MNKLSLLKIVHQSLTEEISDDLLHSIIQVNSGKQGVFKSNISLPVLDVNGNPLVSGKRYHDLNRNNRIVLIKEAIFGSSNIMDTYYRVYYYYGEDLKESFTVVNGNGSVFSGFDYKSNFSPI